MSEILFKEANLINLSQTNSSENFLFELTNFIEKENLHGKKVRNGHLTISTIFKKMDICNIE